MLNHPHDCPVCDEGGECHLQDMTVMTGHNYRRYRFRKRTFRNQYLGPFLNHEMNRCIQCYRCVRFYREYAGGSDLNAFRACVNLVFFGRDRDGVLENEFAGNLVEVCPTGVFTDATLKHHYTRKWDLQIAPSICVHCGLGCNISIGERYGHAAARREPLQRRGQWIFSLRSRAVRLRVREQRAADPATAYSGTTRRHCGGRARPPPRAGVTIVIGIGSPRASLESNFALRALVGADRFYAGIPASESSAAPDAGHPPLRPRAHPLAARSGVFRCRVHPGRRRHQRCTPDGAEPSPVGAPAAMQTAERLHIPLWMDHGVREAVQDENGPLFIASTGATRLDDIATHTYRAAPDDQARLGFAVANALDPRAPAPSNLPEEVLTLAAEVAQALKTAKHPLVISGPSNGSVALIQAAANVAWALPGASLAFTARSAIALASR